MSDISDLHGVYPTSLRWNAEVGFLAIAVYNVETGERELQEIDLGRPATFVMDLATRERGYGLVKIGQYSMILTPVGTPAPPWPGDKEYKPAVGCWVWNPIFGDLRLETNASIFRSTVDSVWTKARFEPEAAAGLQPVVCFVDRVKVPIESLNKTFFGPVIRIAGWTERDQVPGWKERAPTVPAPVVSPLLTSSQAPAEPVVKTPSKAKVSRRDAKPPDDPPFNDDIPWK